MNLFYWLKIIVRIQYLAFNPASSALELVSLFIFELLVYFFKWVFLFDKDKTLNENIIKA